MVLTVEIWHLNSILMNNYVEINAVFVAHNGEQFLQFLSFTGLGGYVDRSELLFQQQGNVFTIIMSMFA